MPQTEIPVLSFTETGALEKYLCAQPADSKGFWIKLSKAGAPAATISKDKVIESALCCGWIDGQLGKGDDVHHYLVRMTPRRAGSRWSAKNRDAAERLVREGRMKPAGLREIEEAKRLGRWAAAYVSQSGAEPPADFLLVLKANAKAAQFFETLDRANRYAVIYRVNDAKRADTRARRITDFVQMLARGETLHPLKERGAKARKPGARD